MKFCKAVLYRLDKSSYVDVSCEIGIALILLSEILQVCRFDKNSYCDDLKVIEIS